jgi:transposase
MGNVASSKRRVSAYCVTSTGKSAQDRYVSSRITNPASETRCCSSFAVPMAKAYPREFRDDVVRVALKGESSIVQIAKDFGIAPGTLNEWLRKAGVRDASKAEPVSVDSAELREADKRIRMLEQEVEVLRRAAVYLGKDHLPK